MILLAVWILTIQPHTNGQALPEFRADQVEFASQEDCEAYAQKRASHLVEMKKSSGHPVTFPGGTTVTHTCKSM